MKVLQLIDEVRRQVPEGAPFGTRWKATSVLTTPQAAHTVDIAARIDVRGHRREQFWCDGVRVEQAVLLRLTCSETECPHVIEVRSQWRDYHRRGPVKAPVRPPCPQPLMTEIPVNVNRGRFIARPARFPCITPCPHRAHPPLMIDKTGFDLFEDDACVGGGVVELGGVRRPRIPSLPAAEAFVLARQLETLAALRRASGVD